MSNITNSKKVATDDEDLKYVFLCQKGDVDAFEVLVERHQKKMLNIAFRMMGDYDEACDVTQESFVSAYRSIKKFKAEAKYSTWLHRIVVNYCKNRLKQLRGKTIYDSFSLNDSGGAKRDEIWNQLPANDANPGIEMENRERDARVQQCITSLEEEYKEVVILRDIQGLTYEEIRDILQIPDGTVKSRLSRARSALKDCLTKFIGDL
jgi:RNA polymerase sigma-70 factor (ECF subfamily)